MNYPQKTVTQEDKLRRVTQVMSRATSHETLINNELFKTIVTKLQERLFVLRNMAISNGAEEWRFRALEMQGILDIIFAPIERKEQLLDTKTKAGREYKQLMNKVKEAQDG